MISACSKESSVRPGGSRNSKEENKMKQQIHDLLNAAPFQPFIIHMNDGREFRIEHPEVAYAGPHPLLPVIIEITDRQQMLNPRLIASVDLEAGKI